MEYLKEKNVKNKNKTLYVMCGLPGAGKTHTALRLKDRLTKHISRDEIRLSMLSDEADYFSEEVKVFSEFARQIQDALDNDFNVVADATHISRGSRAKLLNALKLNDTLVVAVDMFDVPFGVCQGRNREREGRARVPQEQMEKMNKHWSRPSPNEGFDTILTLEYKGDR